MQENAFGKLVRTYRKQRGWKQEELAERWNVSSAYVSLIERGKRKLEKQEQIHRLADLLEIPQERLDAVGKGIPQRRVSSQKPADADDILLQTLLEPSLAAVKLSWLLWLADGRNTVLTDHLTSLIEKLDEATTKYHGEFLKPAHQVLAYAHEMQGNIAFDHLNYAEANGHFQEMLALGKELNDPDILTLAQVRMGDILRKRGRYETAIGLLTSLNSLAMASHPAIQGVRWQIMARAHAAFGKEAAFLEAIDQAQALAENMQETLETLSNQFNLVEILQEKGQGYTMLWQPQKALEIYQQTDRLKLFRPLRNQGSYTIIKAQAYTYAGDLDTGIDLAIRGLHLAKNYQSKRHVSRVQTMYERLSMTPLIRHPRIRDLKSELTHAREALQKL